MQSERRHEPLTRGRTRRRKKQNQFTDKKQEESINCFQNGPLFSLPLYSNSLPLLTFFHFRLQQEQPIFRLQTFITRGTLFFAASSATSGASIYLVQKCLELKYDQANESIVPVTSGRRSETAIWLQFCCQVEGFPLRLLLYSKFESLLFQGDESSSSYFSPINQVHLSGSLRVGRFGR